MMIDVTKAKITQPSQQTSRTPGIWGVGVVLAFLAYWALQAYLTPENRLDRRTNVFQWPVDFQVYFEAVGNLEMGRELYAQNWIGPLPFTYPPFAAVVMRAFLLTDFQAAAIIWQVGSALVMAMVIAACFRRLGYRWGPGLLVLTLLAFFALLNLNSVQGTFFFGQINLYLLGLIAWDFLGDPNRKYRGIGTGLAAGLKLTPAFHGAIFLLEKKWWAGLVSFGVFLVTMALGFFYVPDAAAFWTGKITETERIGEEQNPGALCLKAMIVRHNWPAEYLLWILSVFLVLFLFYIAATAALKRNNYVMVIGLSGTVAALVSPFSWYHHWVFSIPLALALLEGLRRIFTGALVGKAEGNALWWLQQLAGLAAGLVVLLVFVPQAAEVSWAEMHFHQLSQRDNWFMQELQIYTTVALLGAIAAYYWYADRRQNAS